MNQDYYAELRRKILLIWLTVGGIVFGALAAMARRRFGYRRFAYPLACRDRGPR